MPALCAAHSDCNNERFCDGLELCVPGDAMADARGCVPGELPCGPTQTCDESIARCLSDCDTNPDADGDGDCDGTVDEAVTPAPATAEHCGGCNLACPTGFTCDGTMCIDIPVKLAAGATSTCALTAAGNVWCWGGNEEGEIGIGSTDLVVDRPANVALPMPAVDISIVSGYVMNGLSATYIANVCAVLMNGNSECWGTEHGSTPTASSFPSPTGSMVAFTGHLARNSAGVVYRLNHDYTWSSTNLGPATALTTWCARRADGNLHCLSSSDAESEYPAVAGGTLQNSGLFNSHCATRSDGRLLCWGSNAANQIGPGPANIPVPVLVTELPTHPVVSVSVHSAFVSRGAGAPGYQHGHTCAALVDGRTYCWGRNSRGEVGNGTTSTDAVTSPALVSTTARFVHVAAGFSHTCAISDADEVWCWGANNGILGTADTTDALVPARLFDFPVTVAPTPAP